MKADSAPSVSLGIAIFLAFSRSGSFVGMAWGIAVSYKQNELVFGSNGTKEVSSPYWALGHKALYQRKGA